MAGSEVVINLDCVVFCFVDESAALTRYELCCLWPTTSMGQVGSIASEEVGNIQTGVNMDIKPRIVSNLSISQ